MLKTVDSSILVLCRKSFCYSTHIWAAPQCQMEPCCGAGAMFCLLSPPQTCITPPLLSQSHADACE